MSNQMSGEVFLESENISPSDQVSSMLNTKISDEELEKKMEEYNRNGKNKKSFKFNPEDIKKYLPDLNLAKLAKANERNAAKGVIGKRDFDNFLRSRYIDIIANDRLTYRQLLFWLHVGLPIESMEEIFEVSSNGKFEELLPFFEKVDYDYYKVRQLLKFRNLPNEQLDFIANSKFSVNQMVSIGVGIEHGFSLEKINLFVKPEYKPKEINAMRRAVEYNCTLEQIKFLSDFMTRGWHDYTEEYNEWCVDCFRYAMLNYGLTLEQANKMKLLIKLVPLEISEIRDMVSKACGKPLPHEDVLQK